MEQVHPEQATIEGELCGPTATVQLVRFHIAEPIDDAIFVDDAYLFDLCLTPRPRNARFCYPNRWGPNRFERLGKVFFVPPREVVRARSDERVCQVSVVCRMPPETIRTWLQDDLEWTDRRIHAGLDIADTSIRSLLLRLADEIRHPGFASQLLLELISGQIAIYHYRYSAAITQDEPHGGLASWRLRLIEERLKEVREPPTLAELASHCSVSVRQLTRGYRASRGRSIGHDVADSRLNHARDLLATGQSVKSVAYSLGFTSPSSFCCAFRRATGESPLAHRRRAQRVTH